MYFTKTAEVVAGGTSSSSLAAHLLLICLDVCFPPVEHCVLSPFIYTPRHSVQIYRPPFPPFYQFETLSDSDLLHTSLLPPHHLDLQAPSSPLVPGGRHAVTQSGYSCRVARLSFPLLFHLCYLICFPKKLTRPHKYTNRN